MKGRLLAALKALGHRVTDCGTFSAQPCDYPLIGAKVARLVSAFAERGGFLLSSGCEIPLEAKPENIAAMVAACRGG